VEDSAKRIRDALRESLQGNLKAAAMTVYEGASERDAGSRMAKWWDGTLNPPPLAYVLALTGPTPEPLLRVLADLAGVDTVPRRRDPDVVREEVREELRDLGQRVADALERLDATELPARRGPHRVRSQREERRRPA